MWFDTDWTSFISGEIDLTLPTSDHSIGFHTKRDTIVSSAVQMIFAFPSK